MFENKLFEKESIYYTEGRKELLKYIPDNSKSILDIGCSSGYFLNNFKNTQIYTVGIEPDLNSAIVAKDNADLIINSEFNAKSVQELLSQSSIKEFDCIFFNDVLEHLYDPWEAIELCKSLLSSSGVIIASIPNLLFYSNIWNILKTQDFKYEAAGIMDITHIRFFTKKAIIRMFEAKQYSIKKIEGLNPVTSLKFKLANFLLFDKITDLRFMQFVVIAGK